MHTFLLAALAVLSPGISDSVELIPREVFFGNPERAAVRISPGGDRLSYLAPHQGVMNVWVEHLDGTGGRPVTSSTTRPIQSYFWAHNNEQIVYLLDRQGDENHHFYAVDVEGGGEIDLTPRAGIQARLVATDRRFPDEILVGINDRVPQLHDVWRVNTRTGDSELAFRNDRGFAQVLADADFRIRLGREFRPDGGFVAYLRDDAGSPWYELATFAMEDAATSGALGFSRDGQTLYVIDSRRSDTGGLHAFTINEGDPAESTYQRLAHDPLSEVGPIVVDPESGRPQAVGFDYLRRDWTILDDRLRRDWAYLQTVADGELAVQSRDHDDDRWIVSYVRDDGPVEYYLYRRSERKAGFLFTNRKTLRDLPLAKMQPVIVRARDGLPMVSYLTLPPEGDDRNLPMVLLVHGGPWAQDSWGYNPVHQWLANRGYAVLSVNFRGSTGFGKAFVNAGTREWAGRMQDDLIDAVNWAVSEGVAHPDRVAIMGGSYGGYAVLVGLTFTPDFFAAGVDIVGPSHVRTLLESIPPYWEPIRALFESRVGSLDNPQYLDSISPLTRVDQISRPLLIGQGANDPRVKEAESRQIVEAMQSRGLPVTYVIFPDEGHGFARPENNLAFFAITEAFLAQHLGGRAEPIHGEVEASSAEVEAGAELIPGL